MIGSSYRHARVYYRGIDAVGRALFVALSRELRRDGERETRESRSRPRKLAPGFGGRDSHVRLPDGDAHARVHSGDRWTSRLLMVDGPCYVSSDWDMVEGATSLYDSSQRHVELDSRSGDHGDHRSVMPLPTFSKYPGLTF